jgi:hypothetical protein
MFPLQWQDLLEAAREVNPSRDSMLGETIRFLERRGFERFRGFHKSSHNLAEISGHFYMATYFQRVRVLLNEAKSINGGFYGTGNMGRTDDSSVVSREANAFGFEPPAS